MIFFCSVSLTYEYGRLNRLKHLRRCSNVIASYTYDQNGNRKTLSYSSGITKEYVYNDANLLTDLFNRHNSNHRSSFHYTYSLDGNQVRKVSKVTGQPDKATNYTYDSLGRLVEENEQDGSRIRYEYDRFSNRLKITSTDYANRQTVTSYTYDMRNLLDVETKLDYKGGKETFHYLYDFNGAQTKRIFERFSPTDRAPGNPKTVLFS